MPRIRRCRYPGCHAMVKLPDHYCQAHYEHEAEYLAKSSDKQYQHRYNMITRNRNSTKQNQYQFYRSRQWQSLRQEVLDRDHYVCCYCGQPNSNTVDHVVPVEYDETLKASVDNLATICRKCHRVKTGWEQDYYGTGQGNQHKQVEEIHDVDKIKHMLLDGRKMRSKRF